MLFLAVAEGKLISISEQAGESCCPAIAFDRTVCLHPHSVERARIPTMTDENAAAIMREQ
jgi:hypothetical protein